ncbi:MAG: tetratricopeptide repeat protein [Dehalococcoidia bacterium]|nr:tetratricopeptide repeat protein [Dehalococcoidia bacterium]
MEESKTTIFKNLVLDATQLALKGEWKKAITANKQILSINKADVPALNRIGKAQLELGKLKDSKNSYTKALQIDPLNTIARRNLKELEQMKDAKTLQGKKQNTSNLEKLVRNEILIQTASRSAEFIIDKPNSRAIKNLVPGTELAIIVSTNGIEITNTRKVSLGTIEPRSSIRLKTCIDAGSKFEVIFKDNFEDTGIIQILEIHRDPSVVLETPFIHSIVESERSKILADVMLYSEDENAELGLEDDWATIDMSDDDEKVEEENLANEGFQTIDTNTNSNDEEEDDDEDEADEEERVTNEIEEADDDDDDAVVKEASSELVLEEKPEITDTTTDKNDESDAEEDTK